MNKKVWIDLTDISGWTGNFTGIQRVVYNLAYNFHTNNEADFFRYDEKRRKFYIANFDEIIERFRQQEVEDLLKQNAVAGQPKKSKKDIALDVYVRLPNAVKLAMPPLLKVAAKKSYKKARRIYRDARQSKEGASSAQSRRIANFHQGDKIVVLGNNWDRSVFVDDLATLKSQTKLKVYNLVYDLIPIIGPQLFGLELFAIYSRYLFEVAAVSDGLLCISKSTENDLKGFCIKVGLAAPPTKVIRLGDSLERAESVPIKSLIGTDFILCVGTIEVRKNHMLLYYAWKEAIARGIELPKLVIVGKSGWHTADLRRALRYDPEIQDKIMILERTTDPELRWLYENCLMSVYPSFYEGWGLPIAESLAYGKLCLAANTSSMPEIAGNLIDYFSPYDTSGCLDVIVKYVRNPKLLAAAEQKIKAGYKSTPWSTTYEEVKSFLSLN